MSTQTAPLPAKNETVTVKIIDSKSDELGKSLGLSDERRDELCELVQDTMEDHSENITEDMVTISSKLHNHNELAWAMFMYGTHLAMKDSNPLASLAAIMQRNSR